MVPQPNPNEAAAEEDDGKGKKKKPKPKRDTRPMRSSSTNDVTDGGDDDPIEGTLVARFGAAYSESVRSFLMTQGVLQEDDLMVRDEIKMLATAKLVGVKNVQLSKLKLWMREMKELGDGPTRVLLPHEREGSKLKLTKDRPSRQSKSFVAPVPKRACHRLIFHFCVRHAVFYYLSVVMILSHASPDLLFSRPPEAAKKEEEADMSL